MNLLLDGLMMADITDKICVQKWPNFTTRIELPWLGIENKNNLVLFSLQVGVCFKRMVFFIVGESNRVSCKNVRYTAGFL